MNTRQLVIVFVIAATAVLAWKAGQVLGKDFGKNIVHDPSAKSSTPAPSPLDFKMKDIDGKDVNLADYKGKVVMIVNVASHCGFTKQYDAIEATYQKYKDQDFVVLAFPSNSFNQEGDSEAKIKEFCTNGKYHVTFPMMAKSDVKGTGINPVYKFLTDKETGGDFAGDITWNFNKFLIDRNGQIMARFPSPTTPDDPAVTGAIEKAIAAK
jgi:glutathione peroxidase